MGLESGDKMAEDVFGKVRGLRVYLGFNTMSDITGHDSPILAISCRYIMFLLMVGEGFCHVLFLQYPILEY